MRRMPLARAAAGLVSLAAAPQAARRRLGIDSRHAAAHDGQVLVSFELADGVTEEFREAIHSGLPTSFAYDLSCAAASRSGSIGPSPLRPSSATVRFDNLTRRHQISRLIDGRVEEALMTEDQARSIAG